MVTTRRYWDYLYKRVPDSAIMVKDAVTEHSIGYIQEFKRQYPQLAFDGFRNGVVGLGSGRTMDFAKFIAEQLGSSELTLIPGTITTDAPWTKHYVTRNTVHDTIKYIHYTGNITIKYDTELLAFIYELEPQPKDLWCICELYSLFTSSWEAINIHKMESIDFHLEKMQEWLLELPEVGTIEWYQVTKTLFDYLTNIKTKFNNLYHEGTEHYIAYYEELMHDRIDTHGQLLSIGIDRVLKYQKGNIYKSLWIKLKKKYKLGNFPSWQVEKKKFPRKEIIEFIENNGFEKCIFTEGKT